MTSSGGGSSSGFGRMYNSKDERIRMSALHGSSPPHKPRTKIVVPRVGATTPEPDHHHQPARPPKPREFQPPRKAGRGVPQQHTPFRLGTDNLYKSAIPASSSGLQGLVASSPVSDRHLSTTVTAAAHPRPGHVAEKVKQYDSAEAGSSHGSQFRESSRAKDPFRKKQKQARAAQREAELSADNVISSDDGEPRRKTKSKSKLSHPEASAAVTTAILPQRHVLLEEDDVYGEDVGLMVAAPDNGPAGEQGHLTKRPSHHALQAKADRLRSEQSKETGARSPSSGTRNRERPAGPIQLEGPEDVGRTSAVPIELFSQEAKGEYRSRQNRSDRRDAHPSSALTATSASLSPQSGSQKAGPGLVNRMKGRGPSAKGAAQGSASATGRPWSAAPNFDTKASAKQRGRPPTQQAPMLEVALASITVSDFWRSKDDMPYLALLVQSSRIVIAQGAAANERRLIINYDDIEKMEASKTSEYEMPLVSLRLKARSQATTQVASFWDEFDTKAVNDATAIVVVPIFEEHRKYDANVAWDEALVFWQHLLDGRFSSLEKSAAKTIKEVAMRAPSSAWPKRNAQGESRGEAGQENGAGRPERERQPIFPGMNRSGEDPRFQANPSPRRPGRAPTAFDERSEARQPSAKAFDLMTPEDRMSRLGLGSDVRGGAPIRRSQRSQSKAQRPDSSTSAEEQDLAVKRPPRAGNEQVLRFPYEGVGAVTLLESDLDRLDDGEFLNDTLIEFGLKLLLEGIRERDAALADQIYIFNSFFYKRLTEFQVPKSYDNVRKWTNKVDLFSKKYIVLPINEDFHWYFAIIVNPHFMTMPAASQQQSSKTQTQPPPPISPSQMSRKRANGEYLIDGSSDEAEPQKAWRPAGEGDDDSRMDVDPVAPKGRVNGARAHEHRGNRTATSDALDDIRTPPPFSEPALDSVPDEAAPQGPFTHSRQPSNSSGRGPLAKLAANYASSPVRGTKRDAEGRAKASELEAATEVDSNLQLLSISPPSGSAQPHRSSKEVAVLDLRSSRSRRQEPPDRAETEPGRSSVASDDTATVDADDDIAAGIGAAKGAFGMFRNEVKRLESPHRGDRTAESTASTFLMDEDLNDGYGEPEAVILVEPYRQHKQDVDFEEAQDVRALSPSSLLEAAEDEAQPPSQRQRQHQQGRQSTLSTLLDVGAPAEEAGDTSSGFALVDETVDPHRGSRIGGGSGGNSLNFVHERSIIRPGEGRPDLEPSPPSDPVQRLRKAQRRDAEKQPGTFAAVGGSVRTYTSRNRDLPAPNSQGEPTAADTTTAATSDNINVEQTIVITIDSLLFSRIEVKKHLRHYLYLEARDKGKLQDPAMTLDQAPQPHYVKAIVPKQPNYADCGIYLLHYFDRFFSDPEHFLHLIMVKSRAERKWEPEQVSGKRAFWKSEIQRLGDEWKQSRAEREAKDKERKRIKTEDEERNTATSADAGASATGSGLAEAEGATAAAAKALLIDQPMHPEGRSSQLLQPSPPPSPPSPAQEQQEQPQEQSQQEDDAMVEAQPSARSQNKSAAASSAGGHESYDAISLPFDDDEAGGEAMSAAATAVAEREKATQQACPSTLSQASTASPTRKKHDDPRTPPPTSTASPSAGSRSSKKLGTIRTSRTQPMRTRSSGRSIEPKESVVLVISDDDD